MRRITRSLIFGFLFTAFLYVVGVLSYGAPLGGKFDWVYGLLEVLISWPQSFVNFERLGLHPVLISAILDVILYSLVAYGASFFIWKPRKLQDS